MGKKERVHFTSKRALIVVALFSGTAAFVVGGVARVLFFNGIILVDRPRREDDGRQNEQNSISIADGSDSMEPNSAVAANGERDWYCSSRIKVMDQAYYPAAAHYEALVHPAMISHDEGPRRVGLVGRLDSTLDIVQTLHVLDQILMHKSVDEVSIFDVFSMVAAQKKHQNGRNHRFFRSNWRDDVNVSYLEDAGRWFMNNFRDDVHGKKPNPSEVDGESMTTVGKNVAPDDKNFDASVRDGIDDINLVKQNLGKETFDVIITRIFQWDDELFDNYYGVSSSIFLRSLCSGLSGHGVLVASTRGPSHSFVDLLTKSGFSSIHVYHKSHDSKAVSYIIAFKQFETRVKWNQNAAQITLALHRSIIMSSPQSNNNAPNSLSHFDEATMLSYQIPQRAVQDAFCHHNPSECQLDVMGFHPTTKNLPPTILKVAKSSVGENAGRGLFAIDVIPEGYTIALGEQVQSFHLPPSATLVMEIMAETDHKNYTDYDGFLTFFYGYGYAIGHAMGWTQYVVDSGRLLFANHGCDGKDNYGPHYSFTEKTVDVESIPEGLFEEIPPYNPVIERHMRHFICSGRDRTSRIIGVGEEVLTNYLTYAGKNLVDWKYDVLSLRGQCEGDIVGDITGYESK